MTKSFDLTVLIGGHREDMLQHSNSRNLDYRDLGLIDYKKAWELQNEIYGKRLSNEVSDTLLIVYNILILILLEKLQHRKIF